MYWSTLTRETYLTQDLIQYTRIYKADLQWSPAESGVGKCRRSVCVLRIPWIHLEAWSSLQWSVHVWIKRKRGLWSKIEGCVLKSEKSAALETWRVCTKKPGDGIQGEGEDWSSSEETEVSLPHHPFISFRGQAYWLVSVIPRLDHLSSVNSFSYTKNYTNPI